MLQQKDVYVSCGFLPVTFAVRRRLSSCARNGGFLAVWSCCCVPQPDLELHAHFEQSLTSNEAPSPVPPPPRPSPGLILVLKRGTGARHPVLPALKPASALGACEVGVGASPGVGDHVGIIIFQKICFERGPSANAPPPGAWAADSPKPWGEPGAPQTGEGSCFVGYVLNH